MNDPKESKYLKAFGKRVADVRRQRGYTQEQLAAKADITPLSIGFIEQGRRWPRLATLQKLAKCLDVTVVEFFKGL
ncbi:MAG TPA: helix-turn-helix transcriptional regulator [Candidatus Saccharimonadales bacterium]|nr:helix-turn-helix transcriptional regulator [Candidatus Saccharimonadales bacterium]